MRAHRHGLSALRFSSQCDAEDGAGKGAEEKSETLNTFEDRI